MEKLKKLKKYISFQLGFWFFATVIVPIISFIFIYQLAIEKKIENKVLKESQRVSLTVASIIENYADSIKEDLVITSKSPSIKEYLLNFEKEKPIFDFLNLIANLKSLSNVYLIDSDLNIVFNLKNREKIGIDLKPIKTNPLSQTINRSSYLMQSEISDFRYCGLEKSISSFAVSPIVDNKKIIGYVAFSISERVTYEKILNDLNFINNFEIFVGSIYSSKAITEIEYLEDIRPHKALQQSLEGSSVLESYLYLNREYILSSVYLPSFRWALALKIEKNRIVESLNDESSFLFIVFLTIFVIFVSTILIVKFVSMPIYKLIKSIKSIQMGDFNKKLYLDSNNEFKVLEESFNLMVDRVKDYQENMENRVKSRTKELLKTKNELLEYKNALEKRVALEVNKRREQEKILLKQSKFTAVSEIISSIAHQWRQPLNSISIAIMDLEYHFYNKTLNEGILEDRIDKIDSQLQYMSKTIDNFMNFFKLSDRKEFNLFKAFDSIISILLVELNYYSIDLKVENRLDKNISIFGYENEFKQAILNILNNSKDSIKEAIELDNIEQGIIFINLYSDDLNIYVEIYDNGIGVDKDILDKIFLPYFSTKSQAVGIGLGLYLTKIIIDNIGGVIRVFNPDDFSVLFKISIPRG